MQDHDDELTRLRMEEADAEAALGRAYHRLNEVRERIAAMQEQPVLCDGTTPIEITDANDWNPPY